MGRTIGLLALLAAAGCGDDDVELGEVQLTVNNLTTDWIRVNSHTGGSDPQRSHDRRFDLAPGSTQSITLSNFSYLDVTVRRLSDSEMLFTGNWGTDELRELHRQVTITLMP
jgi:hypothetical protein